MCVPPAKVTYLLRRRGTRSAAIVIKNVWFEATGVTVSGKQSGDHVTAVQRRRASGASGPHQDRRGRRARTRSDELRRELALD